MDTPSLTAGDDPFERGVLYGQRFAREISDNVDIHPKRFEVSGLTVADSMVEGARWRDPIGTDNYQIEIVRIARGKLAVDEAGRCREVIEAERFEDALRPIMATRRTGFASFMIGHADGEIIVIETSSDHITDLCPQMETLTHSNHFAGPERVELHMEKVWPRSRYRPVRLWRLLARHDGITFAHIKDAGDSLGAPKPMCRLPGPRQPEAKRTTMAVVLIELDARLADGPRTGQPWIPFHIDDV